MVLPLRPVLFSGRGDHWGTGPPTGERVRRKSLAGQRGAHRHPPGRGAHSLPLRRQRCVLGERENAPAGPQYPSQPAAAVGRAVSGARIFGATARTEESDPGHGHPGVSLRRQGPELEVPADEHHRPVYEIRRHQRRISLPDGERGLPGALDRQPEDHHLYHTGGDEVPGRPAPRGKVHQGGHGT